MFGSCKVNMVAFRKGHKLRPIAIGDVWMHHRCYLGSKFLVTTIMLPRVSEYLGRLQLGAGVKGGSEILVHLCSSIRDAILSGDDLALGIMSLDWLVDGSSAFNTLKRSFISTGILEGCRELHNYFVWAYGGASDLLADPWTVIVIARSETGVRQGDPLGPLFFCLGIVATLQLASETFPDVTVASFFDDINLLGQADRCVVAKDWLQGELLNLGLQLNAGKSKLFTQSQVNNPGMYPSISR